MKKITQKEAIFYQLYKRFKAKDHKHVPVFGLMGEVYCEELGLWGFVSYECSARASEIIKENPGLLHRETIVGRSGARYFGYRVAMNARPEMILDPKLLAFYRRIGGVRKPSEREQMLKENAERVRKFDETP